MQRGLQLVYALHYPGAPLNNSRYCWMEVAQASKADRALLLMNERQVVPFFVLTHQS
jgi:hypothetical protein